MKIQESLRAGLVPELAPESSISEALRWAVLLGGLAPSELNSQPWRFVAKVDDHQDRGTLDLLLDERRMLPSVDPTGREAVMACGAALLNVRLALRGAALGTHVVLCPDPARPELLARITVAGSGPEPAQDRPLRLAIPDRSTHRGPFLPGTVTEAQVERLVAEAAYEGAFVEVLDDKAQQALGELNTEAEARLWADAPFRREVAAWSRSNSTRAEDGLPGFAHGLKAWQAWLEPARIRAGQPAAEELAQEHAWLVDVPLTLAVGSASDRRASLLRAGSGLERLLLAARTDGLSAGYLNAALHLEPLRASVGRAVGLDHPQVVLRIGRADVEPPTPRLRSLGLRTQGPARS